MGTYSISLEEIAEQNNCTVEEIEWTLDQIFGTEDPAIIDEMCRGYDMTVDEAIERFA